MDKRHLFGMAAALMMASAAPAAALDNTTVGGGRCECFCDAGPGGFMTYDSPGGCGALTNRTCNLEDPASGGIRSGSLIGCWPEGTGSGQAQAQILGGAVLDPGSGGQSVRPGLTGPLLNGTLQRQ
ncbi:MAG: hypothetical protein ACFCVH_04725 [Alphaproteobacteria bacterium]